MSNSVAKQPQVYILHGWAVDPDNEAKWVKLRQALKQEGIATTFLGLPGLTTSLDEVWDLDDYVHWVLDQLPPQPVVLLGHSFGGQISMRLAAHNPDRVSKLVLIDSSGILDHRWHVKLKRTVFKLLSKLGGVLKSVPGARKLVYKLLREKDYYQASPTLRQTMSRVVSQELWSDLPKIFVPTLLIWGRQDTVTPLHLGEQLAAGISSSGLEVIDGARHSPQFTHPDQIAALVKTFVQEQS